jgi:hypothetical protein
MPQRNKLMRGLWEAATGERGVLLRIAAVVAAVSVVGGAVVGTVRFVRADEYAAEDLCRSVRQVSDDIEAWTTASQPGRPDALDLVTGQYVPPRQGNEWKQLVDDTNQLARTSTDKRLARFALPAKQLYQAVGSLGQIKNESGPATEQQAHALQDLVLSHYVLTVLCQRIGAGRAIDTSISEQSQLACGAQDTLLTSQFVLTEADLLGLDDQLEDTISTVREDAERLAELSRQAPDPDIQRLGRASAFATLAALPSDSTISIDPPVSWSAHTYLKAWLHLNGVIAQARAMDQLRRSCQAAGAAQFRLAERLIPAVPDERMAPKDAVGCDVFYRHVILRRLADVAGTSGTNLSLRFSITVRRATRMLHAVGPALSGADDLELAAASQEFLHRVNDGSIWFGESGGEAYLRLAEACRAAGFPRINVRPVVAGMAEMRRYSNGVACPRTFSVGHDHCRVVIGFLEGFGQRLQQRSK